MARAAGNVGHGQRGLGPDSALDGGIGIAASNPAGENTLLHRPGRHHWHPSMVQDCWHGPSTAQTDNGGPGRHSRGGSDAGRGG
eukprot:86485-Rhodomonas_salina.2